MKNQTPKQTVEKTLQHIRGMINLQKLDADIILDALDSLETYGYDTGKDDDNA